MVKFEDMDAGQLLAAIDAFPWFASARSRLCSVTLAASGEEAARDVFEDSAVYLPDASLTAYRLLGVCNPERYADSLAGGRAGHRGTAVAVAGADYFSREEYESVKKDEDATLGRIAVVCDVSGGVDNPAVSDGSPAASGQFEILTETLAEIYASQNYPEQAIEIYRKLSLQSPEKSAYFATLIEKLNKK